jgi:hypothetical protein
MKYIRCLYSILNVINFMTIFMIFAQDKEFDLRNRSKDRGILPEKNGKIWIFSGLEYCFRDIAVLSDLDGGPKFLTIMTFITSCLIFRSIYLKNQRQVLLFDSSIILLSFVVEIRNFTVKVGKDDEFVWKRILSVVLFILLDKIIFVIISSDSDAIINTLDKWIGKKSLPKW